MLYIQACTFPGLSQISGFSAFRAAVKICHSFNFVRIDGKWMRFNAFKKITFKYNQCFHDKYGENAYLGQHNFDCLCIPNIFYSMPIHVCRVVFWLYRLGRGAGLLIVSYNNDTIRFGCMVCVMYRKAWACLLFELKNLPPSTCDHGFVYIQSRLKETLNEQTSLFGGNFRGLTSDTSDGVISTF